jgi:predicted nucleic acid-binding protein
VDRLRRFCASEHHRFWSEDLSIGDARRFDVRLLSGYRQVTDLYLLGLAQRLGGCLATFDRTVPVKAVLGARRDLVELIAP